MSVTSVKCENSEEWAKIKEAVTNLHDEHMRSIPHPSTVSPLRIALDEQCFYVKNVKDHHEMWYVSVKDDSDNYAGGAIVFYASPATYILGLCKYPGCSVLNTYHLLLEEAVKIARESLSRTVLIFPMSSSKIGVEHCGFKQIKPQSKLGLSSDPLLLPVWNFPYIREL